MVRPQSLPPPYGPGTRVLDEFVVETEVARTPVWDVYTASSDARAEPIVLRLLRRLELPAGAMDSLVARATELVALVHPSLAPLVAAGVHDGRLAIASIDVPGLPLRGLLASAESHRIAARDTGRVVREIAEALQYLHEQRPPVIHGALRPAKIVLRGAERRATLIEWGLEQLVWEAAKAASLAHVTDPSVVACYQAPEAEELGSPVGPPADQFVLASVAFECLVGTRAFPGDAQALRTIRGTQRPWVASARSDLPDELDAVLQRAWFVDPAARYPDVLSFARALEPLVASADETGRTAPLQLESIPAPRAMVDLPPALAQVTVPVIDEETELEVEAAEVDETPPADAKPPTADVPRAPPPSAPVFSRKATLVGVQMPLPPPPAAAQPAAPPWPPPAPAAPPQPPSAFSRKATLVGVQMPPPPPPSLPSRDPEPLPPPPVTEAVASSSPAASPLVAPSPQARPATPAPSALSVPASNASTAPSATRAPNVASNVAPSSAPLAPSSSSPLAPPPREVPRRADIALPSVATQPPPPPRSSSRRWIPIAILTTAIAGAAVFAVVRRNGTVESASAPMVGSATPSSRRATNEPITPRPNVATPTVANPVHPTPSAAPPNSPSASNATANPSPTANAPSANPSVAAPANAPPVNTPVPNVPPANTVAANALHANPTPTPPENPRAAPPAPANTPVTPTPPPSRGERLRLDPTIEEVTDIGNSIQRGIDRCLAGHRPIGRHVFVGVAFDGPTGALRSVAVRGASVTDAMAQCIEAHVRTLHSTPVARRWVQSYHLRLP